MATSLLANPLVATETSKQITKALKCVAFTNMQVGDMMLRKHERLEKRIRSVSEEIELLRADVMENVMNQRERRQQVADIEEDVERAEVLGNALMVGELLAELRVLQEEGRREDALYRSLRKALRSRKRVKKEFIREKHVVEDEMRSFNRKQDLIQSLLSTFAKDSSTAAASRRGRSSASQSDCGSDMSDVDDSSLVSPGEEEEEEAQSEPAFLHKRRVYSPEPARPRRWSADGTYPQTSPQKLKTRVRRSTSLSFPSRPHSLGSVEEESDDYDEEQEDPAAAPAPAPPAAAATASPPASVAKEEEIRSSCSSEASSSQQVAHQVATSSEQEDELLLEEIHDEQDNFYSHSGDSSGDDHESDSEDDHFHASPRSTTSTAAAMSETASVASDEPPFERPARKLSLREAESTTSTISIRSSTVTTMTAVSSFSAKTSCDHVEVALAPMQQQEAMAAPTAAA